MRLSTCRPTTPRFQPMVHSGALAPWAMRCVCTLEAFAPTQASLGGNQNRELVAVSSAPNATKLLTPVCPQPLVPGLRDPKREQPQTQAPHPPSTAAPPPGPDGPRRAQLP